MLTIVSVVSAFPSALPDRHDCLRHPPATNVSLWPICYRQNWSAVAEPVVAFCRLPQLSRFGGGTIRGGRRRHELLALRLGGRCARCRSSAWRWFTPSLSFAVSAFGWRLLPAGGAWWATARSVWFAWFRRQVRRSSVVTSGVVSGSAVDRKCRILTARCSGVLRCWRWGLAR